VVPPGQRLPDVAARRSRKAVHTALLDALGVLRYQRDRWTLGPHGSHRPDGPALYAHAWRALADDVDIVMERLALVRDTARAEAARLDALNGD
jgi:hypothetical protein